MRLRAPTRHLHYLRRGAPANASICCSFLSRAKGLDVVGGWKARDSSLEINLREPMRYVSYVKKLPSVESGNSKWKQEPWGGCEEGSLKEHCKGDCHWGFTGLLQLNWKVTKCPCRHACSTAAWDCSTQRVPLMLLKYPYPCCDPLQSGCWLSFVILS